MSDKCPKCGAEQRLSTMTAWECGSTDYGAVESWLIISGTGPLLRKGFQQSKDCRIRELEAENERLRGLLVSPAAIEDEQ